MTQVSHDQLLRKTRRACLLLSETTGKDYDQALSDLVNLILGSEYDSALAAAPSTSAQEGK